MPYVVWLCWFCFGWVVQNRPVVCFSHNSVADVTIVNAVWNCHNHLLRMLCFCGIGSFSGGRKRRVLIRPARHAHSMHSPRMFERKQTHVTHALLTDVHNNKRKLPHIRNTLHTTYHACITSHQNHHMHEITAANLHFVPTTTAQPKPCSYNVSRDLGWEWPVHSLLKPMYIASSWCLWIDLLMYSKTSA